MNILYIRYALEVMRCGSINRAAKRLYVSQSTLSRGIKELENEIGILIFERSVNGMTTTHQGKEFLSHASRLDVQYKHLEDLYFNGNTPDVFHLSISSVRYAVAAKAIINVYNRHKGLEFQDICFEEDSVEKVIDHVYDGLFSLGIIITPTQDRAYWKASVENKGLTTTLLDSRQAHAFMGKAHPLASKECVTPEELLCYPHATMAQSDISPINYCSGVNNYDYRKVSQRILVSDRAALYDILRSTNSYYIGLNLGDVSACTHNIIFKPIAGAEVKMDCMLLHMAQHRMNPIEEEFIKELTTLMCENDMFETEVEN